MRTHQPEERKHLSNTSGLPMILHYFDSSPTYLCCFSLSPFFLSGDNVICNGDKNRTHPNDVSWLGNPLNNVMFTH